MEGRKISTSRINAIWVKDLLAVMMDDSIRYYLLANGTEKRMRFFLEGIYQTVTNGVLLRCVPEIS